MARRYGPDIDAILARRYDNGADYWATPDGGISKGSPFTTLDCALMLADLGVDPAEPVLRRTADVIFSTLRADGRFRVSPRGAIYPCHTINALRALCHLGFAADARLAKTFDQLVQIEHGDGGWQCRKFSYGRGPETLASNPGPTLAALDALRLSGARRDSEPLGDAVEFLLSHWVTRAPLGPCHFGIGTLFMQVTYPFAAYNLFFYVYVLSFYEKAREDPRFLEALQALESTMAGGEVIVQRPHPRLAALSFCRRGEPSALATERYGEIRRNLGRA
ncbi:hypothetical protein [Microbacterium sulfonylureivorans]|uniref:hypothetical protein n=1 Tax=Microbacterium sulfonylureivorans TaxID=2486854 RepID=UPI00197C0075|nr:hypothetical protein [Microbacterium sulfonylureivorans]